MIASQTGLTKILADDRLRPGFSRAELSVLGRALFYPSNPGQLGPHPRRKAPFNETASQKSSSRVSDRSTQCFQNTSLLGRNLESKRPCWLNNSKLRISSSTSPSLRSSR